jgi:hypothetical protein
MKSLIRILTIHAIKDLFRYRSFFILIFVLFLLDRSIHYDKSDDLTLPSWEQWGESFHNMAVFVFEELPPLLGQLILTWQTWSILVGLFLLKQLISMWPSSDMRRMHRKERSGFGLITSLTAINWQQVVWDAIALLSLCGTIGAWICLWYLALRWGWNQSPTTVWLWALGILVFIASPLVLAGFSYSSKLAVLSRGSFRRKLKLFFRLFTDPSLLARSWLFYLIRQIVEMAFVAVLPALIILTIPQPWLRIPLAGVVATPVYSYLKMASFKFFLYAYGDIPEVQMEYEDYYCSLRTN